MSQRLLVIGFIWSADMSGLWNVMWCHRPAWTNQHQVPVNTQTVIKPGVKNKKVLQQQQQQQQRGEKEKNQTVQTKSTKSS